jgi:hypothetical protein
MLHAIGSPLPEYRVRALNAGPDAGNLIHIDEHARRYGFRGGLVAGSSVYAYITRSVVDYCGRDWLERGSSEIRFLHPVYDGEELRAGGTLSEATENGGLGMDLQMENALGVMCTFGTARLPPGAAPKPVISDYPEGKGRKRPVSLDALKVGSSLTPVRSEFTWNVHWEYCQKIIHDHHPIYRQMLHPAWLLSQVSRVVAENFDLTAWIAVLSLVQHYHAQEAECTVETRGRLIDKFERHGHHGMVLDLAVFTEQSCLETIRQSVIFRIAPRAA